MLTCRANQPDPTTDIVAFGLGMAHDQSVPPGCDFRCHIASFVAGAGHDSVACKGYEQNWMESTHERVPLICDIDVSGMKPGLQVEITVDDPVTFTAPWSGFVTYRPVLGVWPEAICAENTQGSGSSWVVVVLRANKPDF